MLPWQPDSFATVPIAVPVLKAHCFIPPFLPVMRENGSEVS